MNEKESSDKIGLMAEKGQMMINAKDGRNKWILGIASDLGGHQCIATI